MRLWSRVDLHTKVSNHFRLDLDLVLYVLLVLQVLAVEVGHVSVLRKVLLLLWRAMSDQLLVGLVLLLHWHIRIEGAALLMVLDLVAALVLHGSQVVILLDHHMMWLVVDA